MDNIVEKVTKAHHQELTDQLNLVDATGNIKFTLEEEKEGQQPFLDAVIVKKEDTSLKVLVNDKPSDMDHDFQLTSHSTSNIRGDEISAGS